MTDLLASLNKINDELMALESISVQGFTKNDNSTEKYKELAFKKKSMGPLEREATRD